MANEVYPVPYCPFKLAGWFANPHETMEDPDYACNAHCALNKNSRCAIVGIYETLMAIGQNINPPKEY